MSNCVSRAFGCAHDRFCDDWYTSRCLSDQPDLDDCTICDLIAKVRTDEQDLMREDCDCADCLEQKPPPLPPSVGVPERRWFR